jgi:hypothetical protein
MRNTTTFHIIRTGGGPRTEPVQSRAGLAPRARPGSVLPYSTPTRSCVYSRVYRRLQYRSCPTVSLGTRGRGATAQTVPCPCRGRNPGPADPSRTPRPPPVACAVPRRPANARLARMVRSAHEDRVSLVFDLDHTAHQYTHTPSSRQPLRVREPGSWVRSRLPLPR